MRKINIIMDCDPGIDDAVAIMLAAAHPEAFNLMGIVAVAGNQTLDRVTENACAVTELLGMDVPVGSGAEGPLLREVEPAPEIHGEYGLGYCRLAKSTKTPVSNGIKFMYETIMALTEDEKVTLVPTAPLTDIALLLKTFPEIKEKIELICLMGGGAHEGNVTPTAEFNIWADPEAAQMVFASGCPIVMCGLDITNHCGISLAQIKEMEKEGGPIFTAVAEMLNFYFQATFEETGDIVAVHDAATYMYLLHPEYFKAVACDVHVDCTEDLNRGMTVCDLRPNFRNEDSQVCVLMEVDAAAYNQELYSSLKALNDKIR